MTDPSTALAVITAGFGLGGLFYGGLWWTVRQSLRSPRPALLVVGSALLRMGIALGGFYAVSAGQWQRMLLCLLGFLLARIMVTRLTREPPPQAPTQARHAP